MFLSTRKHGNFIRYQLTMAIDASIIAAGICCRYCLHGNSMCMKKSLFCSFAIVGATHDEESWPTRRESETLCNHYCHNPRGRAQNSVRTNDLQTRCRQATSSWEINSKHPTTQAPMQRQFMRYKPAGHVRKQ